ncbi:MULTISPECIES: YtxH domain-containing protein [Metabacillus]|uniref:YtxH domain-containing protein n=1 Tax=Metabacillus hrfriensis TaxID=3048891 RepID=A0ACD4R8P8_9BACI|nr:MULTISPECIES: YtxH domain-containing protein [Metabacillus]UAL51357.1 YtxH domain-containing protein [Metabacillus dongyingensis]WHZ56865.1 YtxH domain-containing protein [Metabacillus sp. CT-WN-B3]
MSKDGINSKDFLIGTLVGGIVGATTALFLTPKSGKELRDNIGEQAVIVKERTGKITNDAIEKSNELAALAKEKSANLTQVVSDQSSQIMNKVRDLKSSKDQDQEQSENNPEDVKLNLAPEAPIDDQKLNSSVQSPVNETVQPSTGSTQHAEELKKQVNKEIEDAKEALSEKK